jgi:hypothetical protein
MHDGRITPYHYTSFGSFVRKVDQNVNLVRVAYGAALVAFALFMILTSYSSYTKSIVGYSFLGANVLFALIYIPYRRESNRQTDHHLGVKRDQLANALSRISGQRGLADQKLYAAIGKDRQHEITLSQISAKGKDLKALLFSPEEVYDGFMEGVCKHSLHANLSVKFFVIKFRMKAEPERYYTLTLSQPGLLEDQPHDPTWHCLGSRKEAGLAEGNALSDHDLAVIKSLVENAHPYCEIHPPFELP